MRNIIKKKKDVYFSNMKKRIKHYPMTDRLIVIRGYLKLKIYYHSDSSSERQVIQIMNVFSLVEDNSVFHTTI